MSKMTPIGKAKRPVVLLTGLSGAGLSSALKTLEDLGFESFDNLPLRLIDPVLNTGDILQRNPIAIAVDARTRDFSPSALMAILKTLKLDPALEVTLVFLTSDDTVIQKRFSETRRRHPLAEDRPVGDGIKVEQRWLYDLRLMADLVIDTSDFSVHDLKRNLHGHFALGAAQALTVSVLSFSYKRGIPREADLVFDVRFLKNPHWDEALRPQTGTEKAVQDYIRSDPDFTGFKDNLKKLLTPLLPRYRDEGKAYLTLAFGCTGGRHRSVFIAEDMTVWLKNAGHTASLIHRDLKE